MKRITAILLTAALLTLSACNGAGEGQVIDLTEGSSQISEVVDLSSKSSTSPEIYANWEDNLPLKLITDIVPVWVSDDEEIIAMLDFDEGSDEWYQMKYINPYIMSVNNDMESNIDISLNDVIIFFLLNLKAHIDPKNYFNDDLSRFVVPAEIIETFALDYFGIENLNNSQSEYYVSDGNYYLLKPLDLGGNMFYKIREVITDGNIIKIYIDWYDEYFTECWKSNVFRIEDNGDTFKYLYVRTLEPMGVYDDAESEAITSDATETTELTTSSES